MVEAEEIEPWPKYSHGYSIKAFFLINYFVQPKWWS
jgi:hypothetical protein